MMLPSSIMQTRLDANPEYYYDVKTRRYRYRDSRKFAPREATLALTRSYLESQKSELRNLAIDLTGGKINRLDAEIKAGKILKEIHLAQATLGAEGLDRLSPKMIGTLGNRLKTQYYAGKDPSGKNYGLKYLFEDFKKGVTSPAQFVNRLGMFAESGKGTYWAIRSARQKEEGRSQARRLLGTAEHCRQCPEYASRGWVDLSDVVFPTEKCDCRVNCKCSIEYR